MNLQKFFLISITLFLLVVCSIVWATEIDKSEARQSAVGQQTNQATTSPRAGEQINWQVISSGGTDGSSASYSLIGAVGQTVVGAGSSDNFSLSHGYWHEFESGGCCNIRADINHDGTGPDIVDLVYLVNYMFNSGPPPPCVEEADINGDGSVGPDIADLVYLVNYMFNGGPPPVPCESY